MPEDALRALPHDVAAEAQAIRERSAEAKFDPSLHLRCAGVFRSNGCHLVPISWVPGGGVALWDPSGLVLSVVSRWPG